MDSKDVLNIPLEECKQLILEYQKTKNSKIFQELLGKFDKYLVYLVHRFAGQYWYLRNEEFQELYHITIIGFEKGILSLRPDWRPEGIFLWVGSYIKQALKKAFEYKRFEVSLDNIFEIFGDNEKGNLQKREEDYDELMGNIDWGIMMTSDVLTADEKEYIKLRFEQVLYLKEIAVIKHTTYGMVNYNLKKILQKLKTILESEELKVKTEGEKNESS